MSESTGPIRVLHVDDEPEFRRLAAELLERKDERMTVETAGDAEEALDRLAEDTFDCVVSDYDMPGRDGIEFLEAVRETHSNLPFVLFTGKGSETIAAEAISAGVSDYLRKGAGADQFTVLANRIDNLVSQREAEAEVTRHAQREQESERYRRKLVEITGVEFT
jgi:DNA-binding NtrC family response regulator